jgi:hypothetical protein
MTGIACRGEGKRRPWFLDHMSPASAIHNVPTIVRIRASRARLYGLAVSDLSIAKYPGIRQS